MNLIVSKTTIKLPEYAIPRNSKKDLVLNVTQLLIDSGSSWQFQNRKIGIEDSFIYEIADENYTKWTFDLQFASCKSFKACMVPSLSEEIKEVHGLFIYRRSASSVDFSYYYDGIMLFFATQVEMSIFRRHIQGYVVQKENIGDRYTTIGKLGHGAHGDVFLAKDTETSATGGLKYNCLQFIFLRKFTLHRYVGQFLISLVPLDCQTKSLHVAIKYIEKLHLKTAINEIEMHWLTRECNGVLKLLSIYEEVDSLALVLKYQSKGSLVDHMAYRSSFSEDEARFILEQMLLTLDYIHKIRIIHRDIKPENILIKSIQSSHEFEVKLADFGMAILTPENEPIIERCGTPGYVAPEIFRFTGYSYKADIFSLGSVFYWLLSGKPLFQDNNKELYAQKLDFIINSNSLKNKNGICA